MSSIFHRHAVKTHASQLWKFIICGGTGFVLDLSSLTLFVEYGGVKPAIAVILSSCVGATFVFFANKLFTFKNREKRYGSQFLKFLVVYGVSIVGNSLLANFFLWIGIHYLLSKMIAIAIGAIWNYALSHGFIFRKNEPVDIAIV